MGFLGEKECEMPLSTLGNSDSAVVCVDLHVSTTNHTQIPEFQSIVMPLLLMLIFSRKNDHR